MNTTARSYHTYSLSVFIPIYMNCFLHRLQLAPCSVLWVSSIVLWAFILLHTITPHSVLLLWVYISIHYIHIRSCSPVYYSIYPEYFPSMWKAWAGWGTVNLFKPSEGTVRDNPWLRYSTQIVPPECQHVFPAHKHSKCNSAKFVRHAENRSKIVTITNLCVIFELCEELYQEYLTWTIGTKIKVISTSAALLNERATLIHCSGMLKS